MHLELTAIFKTVSQVLGDASALDALYHHSKTATCLKDTRMKIREDITTWMSQTNSSAICWVNGPAGVGKSCIARTIAEESQEGGKLAASFFFDDSKEALTTAERLFPTIAYQIARARPKILTSLSMLQNALQEDYHITKQRKSDQVDELIIKPLERQQESSPYPRVVIIDSLDECKDDKETMMNVIAQISRLTQALRAPECIPLRFLITSRHEQLIQDCFSGIPGHSSTDPTYRSVTLDTQDSKVDVGIFLRHHLAPYLSDDQMEWLIGESDGLFIHASTAQKFILDPDNFMPKRNFELIKKQPAIVWKGTPLDHLYTKIVSTSRYPEKNSLTRWIVETILLLFDPLPLGEIQHLLVLEQDTGKFALQKLHSVLNIPDQGDKPVDVYHSSFRAFMLSNDRPIDYHVDLLVRHARIAESCLILVVASNGNAKMTDRDVKEFRTAFKYACRFWSKHLAEASFDQSLAETVQRFEKRALYYWLEALIRLEDIANAIASLGRAMKWLKVCRPCWSHRYHSDFVLPLRLGTCPASGRLQRAARFVP